MSIFLISAGANEDQSAVPKKFPRLDLHFPNPFAPRGLEPKFALRLPFWVLSGQLALLGRNLLLGGT